MLTSFLIGQIVLMVLAPLALGFWLKRRLGLTWGLFLGGALAFVSGWVVTNFVPIPGIAGYLVASVAQMGILYLIYRFQLKSVDTEREAMMVGAGHGGTELILIGIIAVALPLSQMSNLRDATDAELIDLASRTDGIPAEEVEPSRVDELREIIDSFWETPWYVPVAQSAQALALLPIQIALAIVVLGALTHNNLRPLFGAMAVHFLSRILPAYAWLYAGIFAWLALSLLFGGIALWFLSRFWSVIQNQAQVEARAQHRASGKNK